MDAYPIHAASNEMGTFPAALSALVDHYASIDLFRVVMGDAGICSQANAQCARDLGLHYVMVLNDAQPTLFSEAKAVLGDLGEDTTVGTLAISRQSVRYCIWLTSDLKGFLDWDHLHTTIRLQRQTLDRKGRVLSIGERYFVTSLRPHALDAAQWIALLRARWGVENNCHHTFDTQFGEDDRTWFDASPIGALVVILLRRLAYTLLALFRAHTLCGEATRLAPWRDLIRWTCNALIAASEATVAELRARPRPPP